MKLQVKGIAGSLVGPVNRYGRKSGYNGKNKDKNCSFSFHTIAPVFDYGPLTILKVSVDV